jgi:tetratricopeptide (TPR) repeat protein
MPIFRLKTLIFLAVLHLPFTGKGQLSESIRNLEYQLKTASDTVRIKLLLDLSYEYRRVDADRSFRFAVSADSLSRKQKFERGIALSRKALATAWYMKSRLDTAETLARESIYLLNEIGTPVEKAGALNTLGLCLMHQGKYIEAERRFTEARDLYKTGDDKSGEAKCISNLGVVSFYQTQYAKSVKNYLQALRIAEEIKDPIITAECQSNLGMAFTNQKEYPSAIVYLQRARKTYQNLGDKRGESRSLMGLGTAYFNYGNLDTAQAYYDRSMALFVETGDELGIAQALHNSAEALLLKGESERALAKLEQALEIRTASNETYGIALTLFNMAKACAAIGENKRAEALFDSSEAVVNQLGTNYLLAEFYLARSTYFEEEGRFSRALDDMKMYTNLKDSLYNEERVRAVSEMHTIYETEKKEKEILLKDGEIKILQRNRLLYLTIGIALILVISVIAFWYRNSIKRKQIIEKQKLEIAEKQRSIAEQEKSIAEQERSISDQKRILAEQDRALAESRKDAAESALLLANLEANQMRNELEFKRKEITQLALYINQQTEFLDSIRAEIKSANKDDIRSLERELEQKLNISKQRENFDLNVDLINADFYQRLLQQFPSLTENERKLCAMIRLGLSSKEIAGVQNISPKSVDMNRYRLRKKLELPNETDLGEWLQQV